MSTNIGASGSVEGGEFLQANGIIHFGVSSISSTPAQVDSVAFTTQTSDVTLSSCSETSSSSMIPMPTGSVASQSPRLVTNPWMPATLTGSFPTALVGTAGTGHQGSNPSNSLKSASFVSPSGWSLPPGPLTIAPKSSDSKGSPESSQPSKIVPPSFGTAVKTMPHPSTSSDMPSSASTGHPSISSDISPSAGLAKTDSPVFTGAAGRFSVNIALFLVWIVAVIPIFGQW